jgi:AraC-type transcriptional regulator N-terminus
MDRSTYLVQRVDLGKTSYVFGQSRFLLTSIELPIVSRVITASEEAPYLAFFLKLNIATVRDILNTEEVRVPEASIGARGMAIGEATIELVRSCSRMMDILDAPQDIPFLGKLIQREIIYRLLQGTQGARLRAIATLGGQSHRTEKAVASLRTNYEKPLTCGTIGNDCRHGPIYAAPPFSCPYCDESASIPEAASPSCRAPLAWLGG